MSLSESQVIPEDREVHWVEENPKDKEDREVHWVEENPKEEDEDSYDEQTDEYKDMKPYTIKIGETPINLYTEMRYARTVHKKASKGLEDDPPPDPITWVTNGKLLYERWEKFKVEQIGLIEHPDTPKDQKEQAETFLKCAVSVYMDFMCSIYELFFKERPKESKVEEIKEDVKESTDELK